MDDIHSAQEFFETTASQLGLHVSWQKTKIQNLGAVESTPSLPVCGHSLEEVAEFTYLGLFNLLRAGVNQTLSGALASLLLPCTLLTKSGDRPGFICKQNFACTRLVYYPFCCTVRKHGHFCRKIYGSSRSSTCVPNVRFSGYAGMTLSEHISCRPDQPSLCSGYHRQETKFIVLPRGETR